MNPTSGFWSERTEAEANPSSEVPARIVTARRTDYTMTLKQLEYFTAIAEEGTFQAAAEKLHIAAAGSSSFFRADSRLDFSMLAGMPLLIYRRWKDILDNTFSSKHLMPDYYCIADDARTCLAMAEKGLGVAIVPESALTHTDMKNLRMEYHTISNPEIPSSICLVTRASGYMSIPLQAMLRNLDTFDAPVSTQ